MTRATKEWRGRGGQHCRAGAVLRQPTIPSVRECAVRVKPEEVNSYGRW